jgi:hypothetical protein
MIEFLPVIDNDFDFSPLFQYFEEGIKMTTNSMYTIFKVFWNKESLRPKG